MYSTTTPFTNNTLQSISPLSHLLTRTAEHCFNITTNKPMQSISPLRLQLSDTVLLSLLLSDTRGPDSIITFTKWTLQTISQRSLAKTGRYNVSLSLHLSHSRVSFNQTLQTITLPLPTESETVEYHPTIISSTLSLLYRFHQQTLQSIAPLSLVLPDAAEYFFKMIFTTLSLLLIIPAEHQSISLSTLQSITPALSHSSDSRALHYHQFDYSDTAEHCFTTAEHISVNHSINCKCRT